MNEMERELIDLYTIGMECFAKNGHFNKRFFHGMRQLKVDNFFQKKN